MLVAEVGRAVGRVLPRGWRRRISTARASALSARTRWRLQRLAASGKPILAGPYLGEVGFELLYWVPFLAWFAERYEVPRDRIIAVSRGGASSWYSHVASRYRDVFEVMEPGEFRSRNDARIRELGEQKQIEVTALDCALADAVMRQSARDARMLHPSLMYSLFAPFWWGHLPLAWIDAHARFRRLTVPPLPPTLRVPREYTAVKFYFNDCFADAPGSHAFVDDTVHALAREQPVVSLSTGLTIDDHAACEPRLTGVIQPGYEARSNLDVQTAIVGRARQFVGTYGGFAYLAPLVGVPSTAYFSDPHGYAVRHLDVARLAIERLGGGHLLDVRQAHPVEQPAGGAICSSR
jgi:hypothetical protein